MRFAAVLLLATLALAGCSSSNATGAGGTLDAGPGNRALGQPCDPTLPHPCETLSELCSAAVCTSNVCVRVAIDAGPTCSGGTPPFVDAGDVSDAGDAAADDGGAGDAGDSGGDASSDAPYDASDTGAGETDADSDATTDASGD